jgi:autotransporter-associated beta strand protein
VGQSLEAPTGVGVTSIAVANGGSGYIGTPVVQITGGSGAGATGVASVVNGVVTGITITNPGSGYSPSDVLTVSLAGCGALMPATAGTVAFNGGNTSGGLDVTGSGILTLSGTNTYTGPTRVLTGSTLALSDSGTLANSSLISVASGAVLDLTAKSASFNFGSGQTLAGRGTVNIGAGKTVTFAGGTFAPGGSIGSMTIVGNADLTGGVATFELGTAGASRTATGLSDSAAITGNLALGGVLNLIDNAGANGQGSAGVGYYKIFAYTGAESGSFSSITGWGSSGKHLVVNNVAADKAVYLDITNLAVPNSPLTSINFGNVHEGTTVTLPVAVQNNGVVSSFTDTLSAVWGTAPSGFSLSGSISGLGAGSSDSSSMRVGITTTAGGPVGGGGASANVIFASNSLGDTVSAGTQAVSLSATVFNYARANPLPTTIDLGSIHAGGSFVAQDVSVQNTTAANGGFAESLEATAGSWIATVLPGESTNLTLGISDNTAGAKSVSVPVAFTSKAVVGSGLFDTVGAGSGIAGLETQTVTVTGKVYEYASANTLPTAPIHLGSIHAGGSFVAQTISIQNTTAPNGGFAENLEATAGTWVNTLAPGESANLTVGISDNVGAGEKTMIIPVTFTSKAVAGSNLNDTVGEGSGIAGLQTQTVTVIGKIYEYGKANPLPTAPINLGNIHAGGSFTPQTVSVQNTTAPNGGFAESLEASAGSWISTILPGGAADLTVGIDDNTAGAKTVNIPVAFTSKAVAGSGLTDTTGEGSGVAGLQTQTVTVTGTVYNYAVPAPIASPEKARVYRGAPVIRSLTVGNVAGSFYSESLNANAGETSGGMNVLGSVMDLPDGQSDSIHMAAMLDTTLAGAKHGSAVIHFVSNGTRSGLGDTDRGSQLVTMDADVFDHGVASFDDTEKVDTLSFIITGSLGQPTSHRYSIYNLLQTVGFTDAVDLVSYEANGDTSKINSGLPGIGGLPIIIGAGDSLSLDATLDTSEFGDFFADFTLHLTDAGSGGIGGDTESQMLHLHISGQVVPEPSTMILLAVAALGVAVCVRRRRQTMS